MFTPTSSLHHPILPGRLTVSSVSVILRGISIIISGPSTGGRE